jgi:N-acetylglucosaminyldiphosphoundecaprenol N-acetyl-beta-D-mannosaminyltransferase
MLSASSIPRTNVLGIGISDVTMGSALNEVETAADTAGLLGYVTVTGVHGVIESQEDAALKRIHNLSFLCLPDGIPMVWMGRLQGRPYMEQVCGPDFMPALLEKGLEKKRRHFLWGGGDGVVDRLKQVLTQRHPEISIVGTITPPFRPLTEAEELNLVAQIRESKPHYLWVGLSTPKQERFMAGFLNRHADQLRFDDQGLLFFGVGAAFDFQAGLIKEAPRWIRGTGFEWLFRIFMDPKRLWRRYLRNNPRFLVAAFLQLTGLRQYFMDGADSRPY